MSAHLRRTPGPAQRPPRPFSPVETATPADFVDLIYFLRSVRDEIGDGRVEDVLLQEQAQALTHRRGGVAFIVKGDHGVEASLGICFDRPWYTRQFRLVSVWNIVLPDLRASTGHAKSLLAEAKKFAARMERDVIFEELTPKLIETKSIDDPKLRLCGRNMRPAGMVFVYTPSPSAAA